MMLKLGSLFSGYGGLDMGVASVYETTTAWVCDVEPGPRRILAHHWPDVPNLGDITTVDWRAVEPVDIIAGGSPCQDLSHAGRRRGMRAGTRSGLWASMCDAVEIIRPSLVVWENVRGALSAPADSDVESCPLCLGDDADVSLRALGRVLGDLAELGYDAEWCSVRASDVGAPHRRQRVFVTAHPADANGPRLDGRWTPDGHTESGAAAPLTTLLPTPTVTDPGARMSVDRWDEWVATMRERHQNGNGHGDTLGVATRRDMSEYREAMSAWEVILGRPAPAPTEDGLVSPRFAEWMMGLPDGWVTSVPGVSTQQQLRALGNGVVPQQAAQALRHLDTMRRLAPAA